MAFSVFIWIETKAMTKHLVAFINFSVDMSVTIMFTILSNEKRKIPFRRVLKSFMMHVHEKLMMGIKINDIVPSYRITIQCWLIRTNKNELQVESNLFKQSYEENSKVTCSGNTCTSFFKLTSCELHRKWEKSFSSDEWMTWYCLSEEYIWTCLYVVLLLYTWNCCILNTHICRTSRSSFTV